MENGTAVADEVTERIHALETAQATQTATTSGMESTNAATTAGMQATQAAAQAGTWAVMIAGSVSLIVGMLLARMTARSTTDLTTRRVGAVFANLCGAPAP